MKLIPLLERCRDGDDLAWEELVRTLQGRVYGLAYHYLRDPGEARDAAQEVFVRIWRHLPECDTDGRFLSWVVTTTRNRCIDRIRHRDRRPPTQDVPADDEALGPAPARGPEARAAAREDRELLYRALDDMTEINREMILLKEIQELPQRRIAEMLSIPLGTVKARSNRARRELARRILELDPSFGA